MIIMNACLAFIMFGVALHITPDDFRRIASYPRAFITGLVSQWILLPLMTVLLIRIWGPPPSVALGLVLVAACPGGNISNYVTHLGKGNVALSVTLTSTVTIMSLLMTPLCFFACASLVPSTRHLLKTIELDPFTLLQILAWILVLPLVAGMMFRRHWPALTRRIARPMSMASLVIFAAFIFFAVRANWQNLIDHGDRVLGLVIVHNLLAMAMGFGWARWRKLSVSDSRAVCFETGIQNAGLGLVLIFNFFGHLGGMILVTAAWAVWDLISAFLLSLYWSRKPSEVQVPAQ